jgi:hypothetical protein
MQASPCPEGSYSDVFVLIITHLGFYDALNRANRSALRFVVVTDALDAGVGIDDVQGAITLADRLGGAFRNASAAGDAFFSDFHCHGNYSFVKYRI